MCAWAAANSLSMASSDSSGAAEKLVASLAVSARNLAEAPSSMMYGGGLEAQSLATTVLSLCKLGCVDRNALAALEDEAVTRMGKGEFSPRDLDNLSSGYARHELQWSSKSLVVALARAGADAIGKACSTDSNGEEVFAPPRNVGGLLTAVAKLASTAKCCGCEAASTLASTAAVALLRPGRLDDFNLKDLASAAWGLAILGREGRESGSAGAAEAEEEGGAESETILAACMQAVGAAAVPLLAGSGSESSHDVNSVFVAQECSRLLYAMGTAGVRCVPLEEAAGAERDLNFSFGEQIGAVVLKQVLGGTQRQFHLREATGAIAGNGGALFLDAFVCAQWLAKYASSPSAVLNSAVLLKDDGGSAHFNFVHHAAKEIMSWRRLNCVELGAGLGLCSIVAQRLGVNVIATDGEETGE